jgi:hypothetical protein
MNRNLPSSSLPSLVLASVITLFISVFAYIIYLLLEEEQSEHDEFLLRHSLQMILQSRRKRKSSTEGGAIKRRYILWDRDRAHACIMDDYLGPVPRFNEDGFKRMFCISRQNYERIRNILCQSDVF